MTTFNGVLLAGWALAAVAQPVKPAPAPERLLTAAAAQIGVTLYYDSRYTRMAYPGGDLPPDRGVCTDVVIRAYRQLGIDLQKQVHEDISQAWEAYPHAWGLKAPDRNIDHRRVPNLQAFFRRHGAVLPISLDRASYHLGDLVTWDVGHGRPHIGIVARPRTPGGTPLIVHNIGFGTRMDDILFAFRITGHYRYLPS